MEMRDENQEQISLADLMPAEHNDPVAVRLRMSGEFRLLWAVLEDGIDCYLRYANHPSLTMQDLFRDAEEWIESDEEEWLCSFIAICRAFQIDPGYLRRGLRQRLRTIRVKRSSTPLKRAA